MNQFKTVAEWPKIDQVEERTALVVVQHFVHSSRGSDRFEYMLIAVEAAGKLFAATKERLQCGPYHQSSAKWTVPDVAYGPVEGEPGGKYGSMGTYGVMVSVFVKDPKRPDRWQTPGVDKDGRIYVQAYLEGEETLPGYGYMRRKERRRTDLPKGLVFAGSGADLVNIGGQVVPQEALNQCRRKTGKLPTHVAHFDHSGSYLYLSRIIWGDEPQILAEERALRNK
jgi:hypothetical protein